MIVIIYDGDSYGISKRIDCMLNSTTSSGKRTGILAIGAHPDDIELGCGASLSYYSNEKVYIISVVMTLVAVAQSILIVTRNHKKH